MKVKKFLNNVMQEELRPIRERRKMWEQRLPDVYELLREGSKKARSHRRQDAGRGASRHAHRLL